MRTVEDLNNALDAALEMTFPASDPIAVYMVEPLGAAQDLSSDIAPDDCRAHRDCMPTPVVDAAAVQKLSVDKTSVAWVFQSNRLMQGLADAVSRCMGLAIQEIGRNVACGPMRVSVEALSVAGCTDDVRAESDIGL